MQINESNIEDINEAIICKIGMDEGTAVACHYNIWRKTQTTCTISYTKNGELKMSSGMSFRRKGERYNEIVGNMLALINAVANVR